MPVIFDQLRGLADSKHSGIEGSVADLVGIDIHSVPGLTKVRQKMTKDSGATIDAFCKVGLAMSDGSTLWFSSTSGKIWRESSGTYTLEHTTTPAAGNAGCLGAHEFDGFIYWATQSRLHQKPTGDLTDWTDATEDFATFTNTDADFHPMVVQGQRLFIGDADFVAKVVDVSGTHTFTADALDIKKPLRVKTLAKFDIDILIGTFVEDGVNDTEILRWDTESDSWQVLDTVPEPGINAFLIDDNFVYVNAGRFGRWYVYDGVELIPFFRVPGDYSPTKEATVHPQSVAMHLAVPVFGLSNVTGNPANQGIYSFGSYSRNYPKVLDLSFPISERSGGNPVLTTIEIGAIVPKGVDLFVAWKNGSTYGVDQLDWSNKYDFAYIETMILTSSERRKNFQALEQVYANYVKKPASTSVSFKYKQKHADSFSSALTVVDDTDLEQVRSTDAGVPDVAALQLRLDFTVSSNNAMEIESVGYEDNFSQQEES